MLNKISICLVSAVMALSLVSCKDKSGESGKMESPEIVKYAKYAVAVYKDQELSAWAATLSKTEPVNLNENLTVEKKGKQLEVSKITLSDGTIAYIASRHLGDQPIVFTEETNAYVRNNTSSKVYVKIPKGTIAFTLSERAEWTQIYIGKLGNKWVTKQWVKGGFTTDGSIIEEAKNYDEAISALAKKNLKKEAREEAMEKLKSLESSSVYGDLVKEALGKTESVEEEDVDLEGKAIVTAKSGLRLRAKPGTDGEYITTIPVDEIVTVVSVGGKEETINGSTAYWYEVSWNGKKGWAFGAFLDIK